MRESAAAVPGGNGILPSEQVGRFGCTACRSRFLLPIPRCLVCDAIMPTVSGAEARLGEILGHLSAVDAVYSVLENGCADLWAKLGPAIREVNAVLVAAGVASPARCSARGYHEALASMPVATWETYAERFRTSSEEEVYSGSGSERTWLRACPLCGGDVARPAPEPIVTRRLVITRLRAIRKFRTWELSLPQDIATDDASMEILNSFKLRHGKDFSGSAQVVLNPDLSGGIFSSGGVQLAAVEVG